MIKKNIGRPPKVNYKVMAKLEDALKNGANVTQACSYASVSRDTYYRYLNNENVFAERMAAARRKTNRALIEAVLF